MGVTFREVPLNQTEAENLVKEKPKAAPPGQPFTNGEINVITPPLSIYESIKGQPYSAEYLGLQDLWKMQKNADKTDRQMGTVTKKIGAVEGWLHREVQRRFMPDTVKSSQSIMKMIERYLNIVPTEDPIARLNKIYSFVVSTNKARAFKQLEKQLQRQLIDEVVNTEYVRVESLGKLLPRKDG